MKRIFHALFATLLALTMLAGCTTTSQHEADSADANAAQNAVETNKAAIGVRTERHLKVALLTARQMLSDNADYQADQVTIVAFGGAVPALRKDGKLIDDINKSVAMGVEIAVCGLTIKHKKIEADALADGVEVVPNGFVELIRLQSEGFHTIEL